MGYAETEGRGESGAALEIYEQWLVQVSCDSDIDALCADHPALAPEFERLHSQYHAAAFAFRALASVGARLEGATRTRYETDARDYSDDLPTIERLSNREARGRYRRDGELARGGMGAILDVWDEDLHRRLAMKVLLESSQPDSHARRLARFLDEAQITAQLDHPGIVPVHEVGLGADGELFFTMKLVEGKELNHAFDLARSNSDGWSQSSAVRALLRVCDAMAFAHARGVVHRDLKPNNVMVGAFGEVYVMDWGLARVLSRDESTDESTLGPEVSGERGRVAGDDPDSPLITRDGDVVGTPCYMAPEQARGELAAIGTASDVYAVGTMLYHLLTGFAPYTDADPQTARELWQRVCDEPPTRLATVAPSAPEELVAICEKAMQRDSTARYPSMSELRRDLDAYLDGRVVRAHRTGAWIELKKWALRNRAVAALGLTALVLGLGASALAIYTASTRHKVVAAEAAERIREIEKHLVQGAFELSEGDPINAIAVYERALVLDTELPEAVGGMTLAFRRLGETDAALEVLGRYASVVDRHQPLRWLRDTLRDSDHPTAESFDLDLRNAADHYLAGTIELAAGEDRDESAFARAAQHFSLAVLRAPIARAHYHVDLAHALSHTHRLKGAQLSTPERARAVTLADTIRREWPEFVFGHRTAGMLLSSVDEHDEAIVTLRALVDRDKVSSRTRLQLAKALRDARQFDAAIEQIDEVARAYPNSADTQRQLGVTLLQQGRTAEALDRARRAVELAPDDWRAAQFLGKTLYQTDRAEEAVPHLRRAVELNPTGASTSHATLGYCLDVLGDPAAGARSLATALRIRPDDLETAASLANLYHRSLGEPASAREYARSAHAGLEAAVLTQPESDSSWISLARVVEILGDNARAEECLRKAVDCDPTKWTSHKALGQYLYFARDYLAAAESLEIALKMHPDPEDYRMLAACEKALERFSAAETSLRRGLKLRPDSGKIWEALGMLLRDLGRQDETVIALERACEHGSRSWVNLGFVLNELARFDDAEPALRRSIQVDPTNVNGHWNLGIAVRNQGRFEEAVAILRTTLGLAPKARRSRIEGMIQGCESAAETAKTLEATFANGVEQIDIARLAGLIRVCERLGQHERAATAGMRLAQTEDGASVLRTALLSAARVAAETRTSHDQERALELLEISVRNLDRPYRSKEASARDTTRRAGAMLHHSALAPLRSVEQAFDPELRERARECWTRLESLKAEARDAM